MRPTRLLKIIHSPVWMVLVGLVVRVLYIVIAHSYRFTAAHWHVFEMANLAYSLATGHGFSSPFGGRHWPFRFYRSALSVGDFAGISRLRYLLVCQPRSRCWYSIASSLRSPVGPSIALRAASSTKPLRSGRDGFGLLLPYAIYWSVYWVWETSLSAFLLSLLFMLTLEMEDDNRLLSWFGYGLLWGIVGLTNPVRAFVASVLRMLARLPVASAWETVPWCLWCSARLVFWVTLMPWLVRNYSRVRRTDLRP